MVQWSVNLGEATGDVFGLKEKRSFPDEVQATLVTLSSCIARRAIRNESVDSAP